MTFCAAPGRDALNLGGAAASTAPRQPEPMAEGVAMALRCVSTPGAALALVRPLPPARAASHSRWVPARPTRPGSRRPTSTSSRAASSTATSSTATSSSSSGAPPVPPGPLPLRPADPLPAAPRRHCLLWPRFPRRSPRQRSVRAAAAARARRSRTAASASTARSANAARCRRATSSLVRDGPGPDSLCLSLSLPRARPAL